MIVENLHPNNFIPPGQDLSKAQVYIFTKAKIETLQDETLKKILNFLLESVINSDCNIVPIHSLPEIKDIDYKALSDIGKTFGEILCAIHLLNINFGTTVNFVSKQNQPLIDFLIDDKRVSAKFNSGNNPSLASMHSLLSSNRYLKDKHNELFEFLEKAIVPKGKDAWLEVIKHANIILEENPTNEQIVSAASQAVKQLNQTDLIDKLNAVVKHLKVTQIYLKINSYDREVIYFKVRDFKNEKFIFGHPAIYKDDLNKGKLSFKMV